MKPKKRMKRRATEVKKLKETSMKRKMRKRTSLTSMKQNSKCAKERKQRTEAAILKI